MPAKVERINEMTDRKAVCECNNNLIKANYQMISLVTCYWFSGINCFLNCLADFSTKELDA